MDDKKVKVGLVGYGYWGTNVARALVQTPHIDLIGIWDENPKRLEAAQELYPQIQMTKSYEELLSMNLDGLFIITPPETHYDLSSQALMADKNVFVEKPLTTSLEKASALYEMASQRKKLLFVDHVFIFSEPVQFLKKMIDSGELGDIVYINSRRINLGLFQYRVDVVWDLAIHDISIINYLIGFEIETLSVFKRKYMNFPLEALANISADLKNGTTVSINVSWLSPVKVREMVIGGTKKTVFYDDTKNEKIRIFNQGVLMQKNLDTNSLHQTLVQYKVAEEIIPQLNQNQSLQNSILNFVECLEGKAKPLVSPESVLTTIAILEKVTRL